MTTLFRSKPCLRSPLGGGARGAWILFVFLWLSLWGPQALAAGCNHNGTCGDSPGEDCLSCPSDCDSRPTFVASHHDVVVGQAIQFTGQGADLFPLWYLDLDGIQLGGDTLTFAYTRPGHYEVRFGGTDGLCNTPGVSDPQTIHVSGLGDPESCNYNDRCGDWPQENCSTCAHDCGACSQCTVDNFCNAESGETCTTCPADCDPPPLVNVSTTQGVVNHPLVFEGTASSDTNAKWDLGNGQHEPGNPLTYTYFQPGSYNVVFTSADDTCGTSQDSAPVRVVIAPEAACPFDLCEDAATIENVSFPPSMCQGVPASASVTVRNVGTSTWTSAAGYKLGTLMDPSPFTSANRVALPGGVAVAPGESYTFTISLDRVPAPGEWTPAWRMVREHVSWFGGVANTTITVQSGCGGGGPTDPEGSFHCRGSVTDAHGRPLSGRAVRLTAERYRNETQFTEVTHRNTVSKGDGSFFVSIPPQAEGVDRLLCRVWPQRLTKPGAPNRKYLLLENAVNAVVQLDIVEAPAPRDTRVVNGFKERPNEPPARMGLYRSGTYDKVIIIPEPMNPTEQKDGPRTLDALWWLYSENMLEFDKQGVDVWIVNTPRTGQNVHEQAAEFAQGIEWAARGYPASLGGGAPNFNGKVLVLTISLGGITARIATARWESDAAADVTWRHDLGLTTPLPVIKIVTIDAPFKGAQVNVDLQATLWDPPLWFPSRRGEFNLNSCAFQQLVFETVHELTPCPTCNHDAFFSLGAAPSFPGQGLCDIHSGGTCFCEKGPAVEHINGNGFAGVPIAAYSDGAWGVPNQCYGNDDDVNGTGYDLCEDTPGAFQPQVGDAMNIIHSHAGPIPISFHLRARASDLVPGSRQAAPIGRQSTSTWSMDQYFAGTFIPITSALAHPNGGCGPDGGPFTACRTSGKSNPHVKPSPASKGWILNEQIYPALGVSSANLAPLAEMTAPSGGVPGQPLGFDASASQDPEGQLTQYRWDFDDGTVLTGSTPTHTFSRAGVYEVRLTVRDATGRTDSAQRRLRIGPSNQAPVVQRVQAQTARVGQSLVFDASASEDSDGWIETHFWNFGDGTLADGPEATHAYASPGTYSVGLTVIDDEGAAQTSYQDVVVAEPAYEPAAPLGPSGCANSVRPEFSWGALPWATRYWLQVTSSALTAPLIDERQLTSTSYTPLADLPASLPLRWRVRACTQTSCGTWSTEQAFQATCSALPAPTIVAPQDCLTTARPTLTWTAVSGADTYEVALERALTGRPVPTPIVTGTSFVAPSALAAYTEYRFRVRANSGAAAGAWSTYRYFTTFCIPEQVGTPAPLEPADAAHNPLPLFEWEAASNAQDYQIEVTSPVVGAFASGWYPAATHCTPAGRCATTLPAPLIGGPTTWRVRARNLAGPGPWSPALGFTVVGTLQSPWALMALADFDADGQRDFVWQHAQSGDLRVWLMNGSVRKRVLEPQPNNAGGGEWELAGAADFNADSKPDLLWQNLSTGELRVWLMNGLTRLAVDTPFPDRPANDVQSWRVQSVGDFDADGKPDILWQHRTEGWLVAWLMDGLHQKSAVSPTPNRPSSDYANWKLATTERFDRSPATYWIWQHQTAGWLVPWQMQGLVRTAVPGLTPNVPEGDATNWALVGATDVDADGKTDLILRNRVTGANLVWRMNGNTRLGTLPLDFY